MFSLEKDRLIHGVKTAFAVLIGFIITKSVHFPVDQWLIITIIVVMCAQLSVGSMIQKSYMRFLGTLTGSLIGLLTIELFDSNPIVVALVITLSTLFFSYIATGQKSFNESGTLGAATVVIILISQNPSVYTALGRFFEISLGILIAAIVSQFFLPIHAKRSLRLNQAQTFRLIAKYYQKSLLRNEHTKEAEIDEEIVKLLIAQRKLANDAKREPFVKGYPIKHFKKSLWYEKELLRCIAFMHLAFNSSLEINKLFSNMGLVKQFHEQICQVLNKIANCLEEQKMDEDINLPDLKPFCDAVNDAIKILNAEDVLHANAFLFCVEILMARLEKLLVFVREINRSIGV